ncbi:hypothetical protein ACFQ8O_32775 [Streptomyces coelicoflavus]
MLEALVESARDHRPAVKAAPDLVARVRADARFTRGHAAAERPREAAA